MAAPILTNLRPSIVRPSIRSSLAVPLLDATHHRACRTNQSPPWRVAHRRPFSYASALTLTHDFVLTVHAATGSHWLLTIPAFAVATSLLFQLPLVALARRRAQRQSSVEPLMAAWRMRHTLDQRAAAADKSVRLTASSGSGSSGRSSVQKDTPTGLLEATVALMATEKRLKRKFGIPSAGITIAAGWLVSMPAFLTATDTLRRMSGASAGPLSLLVPEASDLAPKMLEPSLHSGGIAWFADLAAADPLMALPLATSALMFWRVWPRGNRAWIAALLGTDRSKPREGRYMVSLMAEKGPLLERQRAQAQLALSRLVTFVLPLVPLLAAGLPSSVFVFWMASIVASQALRKAVAARMPIRKWTVEAKKRNIFLDMPK